ncbi:flagellar basal body P-ring formation chaperone FlgA [Solimonas soli]|uniref:flagellar basal body P-ring formation chaperone FlgA n=1 Tax=Solimonas soli TaxID=413479 RepID=UPI0004B561D6|nr:flagellar basal body P-ring formation chaperone FlgA [Solimonas soli]
MSNRLLLPMVHGLALAATLGAGGARAQDAVEPPARLRALAERAVRQDLPASAEVSAEGLDPRLRLPACAQPPAATADQRRGARVSVTLRCAAPQAWTLYVPVAVRDVREVPVLARAVRRGEAFDAGALRSERRDVAQLPFGWLERWSSDAQAYAEAEFRRPLAAGQVPGPDDLAPRRCVRRGDAVTLIGRAAGIEVRVEARALADGARGERIQVENARSRRVVPAIVTGPGTVEAPASGGAVADGPKVLPAAAASGSELPSSRTRVMTSKIDGNPVAPAYVPPSRPATPASGGGSPASGGTAPRGDSLSLTDDALLLQQTAAAASAASGFDQAKVDAVSRELASGSYKIDPQAIAARLVKTEAEIYG